MGFRGSRDLNSPTTRPLKHLRARRAIGATLGGAVVVYLFAAPIIQAKPQDRLATAIIIGVVVLILAFLIGPTAYLKWHARRRR